MSLNDSVGDDSVGSAADVDSGVSRLEVFASDFLGLDMRRLQPDSVIPP
jgi:hypothetical protein